MTETEQLIQLNRMRQIATALLLLMALVFVVIRVVQPAYPDLRFLSFVGAFAEAALIGALADWFAVSALFRHPFGLPIPHTAIIPRNKDRIGDSIGNFLQENFMTEAVLQEELAHIDFAGMVSGWMTKPENSRTLAKEAVAMLPTILRLVEDEDVGRFLQGVVTRSTETTRFAPVAGEILSILVAGNHHQAIFDRMLDIAAESVEHNKPYIRQKVHEHSPRWIPKAIDERFYDRLVDGVQSTLAEMRDERSEWRGRFREMIEGLIVDLKESPEYEEKLARVIRQGITHPLLRNYLDHVWKELRMRLLADAESPDSAVAAKLDSVVQAFGHTLNQDQLMRDKLNQWAREFAATTIAGRRAVIADLVRRVIRKWDAQTVSRKFELHVGKDLQYIRINGTLVGGMIGLALHAVTLALQ